MRNVIPIITGDAEEHLSFTNLSTMSEGPTVKLVPGSFDGARIRDLYHKIRDDENKDTLDKKVIPTKHSCAPVVPTLLPRGQGFKRRCRTRTAKHYTTVRTELARCTACKFTAKTDLSLTAMLTQLGILVRCDASTNYMTARNILMDKHWSVLVIQTYLKGFKTVSQSCKGQKLLVLIQLNLRLSVFNKLALSIVYRKVIAAEANFAFAHILPLANQSCDPSWTF